MPGRGRFWSIGSLNDEIVEEADLVQALQTKINAGAGAGSGVNELLKTVTVPSDTITTTITLDTPVNFADYAEFTLIIHGHHKVSINPMGLRINGNSGSIYSYVGRESNDAGVGVDVLNGGDNLWLLPNVNVEIDSDYYIKLVIQGGAVLQTTGTSGGEANPTRYGTGDITYSKEDTQDTIANSKGGIKVSSFSDTTLVSFTLLHRQGSLKVVGAGTVLSVFGKKIV